MKKTIVLEDLECANCAAKIETAVSALAGVNAVQVNFMTQKMVLDVEDTDYSKIITEIKKVVKKFEPDVTVIV